MTPYGTPQVHRWELDGEWWLFIFYGPPSGNFPRQHTSGRPGWSPAADHQQQTSEVMTAGDQLLGLPLVC
jgi:hypothetical protein